MVINMKINLFLRIRVTFYVFFLGMNHIDFQFKQKLLHHLNRCQKTLNEEKEMRCSLNHIQCNLKKIDCSSLDYLKV
jgi:hypothetical protein